MAYSNTAAALPDASSTLRERVSIVLGILVLVLLQVLLVIVAIPYGTAEAWWKAFFVCASFSLGILWLIDGYLSGEWLRDGWKVSLPIISLVAFAFLQTVSLGSGQASGISLPAWRTLSLDPFETRFFALQIAALVLCGLFLFKYISSAGRLRWIINIVIAIAVASAIFGILRQTTQHQTGFGLPLLQIDQGYGQFINRNHFAFLMEMALGLVLGLVLGRGVSKEHGLVYLAALLPIWTALVLCSSRGGLVAMLAQVVVAAFLLTGLLRNGVSEETASGPIALLRSTPVRIALFVILVGGVAFGTLYLGGEQLATRLQQSRMEIPEDSPEAYQRVSRNETWAMTLKMFAAHPVLGVGMGAYWAAVPQFHNGSGVLTPQEAHNDYLELLASGGIVVVGIFVWFALAVLRKIKTNLASRNRFRRAACLGATIGITGVAVHSLVDFGLHVIVNALVFTTLIVIATSEQPWHNEPIYE